MSISHTDAAPIARRYSTAIFALALAAKNETAVVADLSTLAAAIADNANLSDALANPTVSNTEKAAVLDGLMGKADGAARRAVATVAENGRASLLPMIAQQLRADLAAHKGEQVATVTSARALSAAVKQQLSQSLAKATGKQVQLTLVEDPAVLGGLLIQLGSLRLDATLAGALTSMREQLLAPNIN
ncbi:MAG: ATP synthase F1 subunit delta [Pseudomonadota bacterium]